MIIDTRTGKVLVTKKQLIKDVKKFLSKFTKADFMKLLKKEKYKIKEK